MISEDPDTQVAQTIDIMRRLAAEDATDPLILEQVNRAYELGNGDILEGVFRLVKGMVRFQTDQDTAAGLPANEFDRENVVEILIRPVDVIKMQKAGFKPVEDCDGFTNLVACLLLVAGVPCNYVTAAVDPEAPGRFSHVYVAAYPTPERRVVIDASHGKYLGWEVPGAQRLEEWPVRTIGTAHLLVLVGLIASAYALWRTL